MNKEIVKVVAEIAVGVFVGNAAAKAVDMVVKPIGKIIQAKKESQQ